jgi:hypothetical protein
VVVGVSPGTLLGPEGTGVCPASLRAAPCGGTVLVLVRGGRPPGGGAVSRPWLENCTVDASIFIFVVKLVRAHGGCLGTRSR